MKAGERYGSFSKLIERIASAQKSKGDILYKLIQDFGPIIKKYAFLLKYEDAQADLQLDFIEFICKFKTESFSPQEDQYVLAYIEKAIRNAYIRRSKEKAQDKNCCGFFEDLTDAQKQLAERAAATCDQYQEFDEAQLKQLLTPCQFKVIYFLYYLDLSVKETGQALGISRQAVNQTKNKALTILRQAWLLA